MKYVAMHVGLVALAAALVADPALAQHEGHQAAQSAQTPDNTGTAKEAAAKPTGMMAQMQERMKEKKAAREEIGALTDQVMKSFAAIETENVPAALKAKIDQHGMLLRQLQTKLQAEAKDMGSMCGKTAGDKSGANQDAPHAGHTQ